MAARKRTEKRSGATKKDALAALYTFALILAAVALLALSSMLLPTLSPFVREAGRMEPGAVAEALEQNLLLRLGLSALNVALAAYLLFIYVRDYLRLRASFTLGIIAFLFSFLLCALSSFPLVRMLGPYGAASSISFVPMLFSAIGLLIFAKLGSE